MGSHLSSPIFVMQEQNVVCVCIGSIYINCLQRLDVKFNFVIAFSDEIGNANFKKLLSIFMQLGQLCIANKIAEVTKVFLVYSVILSPQASFHACFLLLNRMLPYLFWVQFLVKTS